MEALPPVLPVSAHQIFCADSNESEPAKHAPLSNPILVPDEEEPWFSRGFEDCAQEAVRYLVEDEGLALDDPIIVGLLQHLGCWLSQAACRSCDLPHQPSLPFLSSVSTNSTVNHHSAGSGAADMVTGSAVVSCSGAKLTKRGCCQEPESDFLLKPAPRFDNFTVGSQAIFPACKVSTTTLSTECSMVLDQTLDPENWSARPHTSGVISWSDLEGILSCLDYLTPVTSCIPCGSRATDHTVSCQGSVLWTSSVGDESFEDKMATPSSICVCDGVCFSGRDTVSADATDTSTFSDSDIKGEGHVSVKTISCLSSAQSGAAPAGTLTSKEKQIRSLALEILTLLQEEALDGRCILDDTDNASEVDSEGEMELEDIVIEVEP